VSAKKFGKIFSDLEGVRVKRTSDSDSAPQNT